MTPDEQARLARVEAEMREFSKRFDAMDKRFDSMDRKIDGLCEIAAMGKGAWYASLRIGGLIVILGAAGWAVFTFMKGVR